MTDADALLRAIIENPDDDAPRLVYADWLDEHGDRDRAEFIRLQCEVARWKRQAQDGVNSVIDPNGVRRPTDDPGWLRLLEREKTLFEAGWARWARSLVAPDGDWERVGSRPWRRAGSLVRRLLRRRPESDYRVTYKPDSAPYHSCCISRPMDGIEFFEHPLQWVTFRRGFPDSVWVGRRVIQEQLRWLTRTHPVLELSLTSASQTVLLAALKDGSLARIRSLWVSCSDDRDLATFIDSHGLAGLRRLDLSVRAITDDTVRLLAAFPVLARLEELGLSCTYTRSPPLSRAQAEALARNPHLRRMSMFALLLPLPEPGALQILTDRFGSPWQNEGGFVSFAFVSPQESGILNS